MLWECQESVKMEPIKTQPLGAEQEIVGPGFLVPVQRIVDHLAGEMKPDNRKTESCRG